MKRFFISVLIGIFLSPTINASDLQKLFDEAAASPNKTLSLKGLHSLSAPVKLSSKHNNLTVLGDNSAVISGEVKIENWQTDGGLWKTKIDVPFVEYLFVNGQRAKIATTGERTVSKLPSKKDNKILRVDTADIPSYSDAERSDVILELVAFWEFKRYYIDSIRDNGNGTSDIRLKNGNLWLAYQKPEWVHFRFANSKSFLTEGHFYFDKQQKTLYYYPRKGETPENSTASIAVLDRLIEINGAENITIKGVKFTHCATRSNYEHTDGQASSTLPAAVEVSNASGVSILDCVFEKTNGYAIAIEHTFKRGKIQNCIFNDIGGGAVRLGESVHGDKRTYEKLVSGVEIRNNIVLKYGREFFSAVGILILDCADNTVADNTIADGYYSGISCGWSWNPVDISYARNNKILRNKITKIGQGKLSDLAGIYLLGKQEGTLVEGNRIEDVLSRSYGGNGIYCDESSSHYTVKNNTIICAQSGMSLNKVRAVRVVNNVIASAKSPITLYWTNNGDYRQDLHRDTVIERNIFDWTDGFLRIAIAWDKTLPIKKLDDNIYFEHGQPKESIFDWAFGFGKDSAKFEKGGFAQWQKATRFDLHSLNADPQIEDGEPQNIEICEKIGFEFFSTKSAGVKGSMRKKLAELGLN